MRIVISKIFKETIVDTDATIMGWIRSVRKTKRFSFLVVNDGSCQQSLQIIADGSLENYEEVSSLIAGASVEIKGKLVPSGGKGQSVEMQAFSVRVLGKTDESYPMQKKAVSLEFLREHAHLRIRTNTFGAVFRVRHALAIATHKFFDERGFFYLNSPIISSIDGEGAGKMFRVSTFDPKNPPVNEHGEVDYSRDYFGREVSLAVTGQLEGECHAQGLGAIYTFGPTFRAENSNTARHLSEFWMIEPEIAFAELEQVAELAADYIKYLIEYALERCPQELEFLAKTYQEDAEDHFKNLRHVAGSDFLKISYTEAVKICSESNEKFEFPAEWGKELQTEHERFLTEKHFKAPVIVVDYPKECKAFYMKANEDGKTVRAMDVLVPRVGEIIGGSQREDDFDKLISRMNELGMQTEDYWWYLELRKFGSVPHGGFGLGFERAIMYITGMTNIRDVIAFPRTPRSADF